MIQYMLISILMKDRRLWSGREYVTFVIKVGWRKEGIVGGPVHRWLGIDSICHKHSKGELANKRFSDLKCTGSNERSYRYVSNLFKSSEIKLNFLPNFSFWYGYVCGRVQTFFLGSSYAKKDDNLKSTRSLVYLLFRLLILCKCKCKKNPYFLSVSFRMPSENSFHVITLKRLS